MFGHKNIILSFHTISNKSWFEELMVYLIANYNLVTLENLVDGISGKKEKSNIHITFDDGEKNFYYLAYPVLKKYHVPVTLFVSPKIIMNNENFWFQKVRGFNKSELKHVIAQELQIPYDHIENYDNIDLLKTQKIERINSIIRQYIKRTGGKRLDPQNMNLSELEVVSQEDFVTIGAHTLNHPILKNEIAESSQYEIQNSIDQLATILGKEVKFFAYPNGNPEVDFGHREIDILNKCQIKYAVSLNQKFITNEDNLLALPRIGISYGNLILIKLKLLLGSNWEKAKNIKNKSPAKVRREIRIILSDNIIEKVRLSN